PFAGLCRSRDSGSHTHERRLHARDLAPTRRDRGSEGCGRQVTEALPPRRLHRHPHAAQCQLSFGAVACIPENPAERYRRGSVYVRAHGILSGRPEYPDLSKRGNPEHRILAFGKWGTNKRLEMLIDAFHLVAAQVPNVKLTIVGGDHPNTPG